MSHTVRAICNHCFTRFEIRLDVQRDATLLKQIAPTEMVCDCPRNCGGKINLTNDEGLDRLQAPLAPPLSISVTELYQALHGFPLPDEVPKDRVVIKSLLQGQVRDAVVEEHNGRFYLHEILMQSGVVLHLAAGGRGAQVFKITKEA
jgi:hypothetical protein